jgi:hypothetical protein
MKRREPVGRIGRTGPDLLVVWSGRRDLSPRPLRPEIRSGGCQRIAPDEGAGHSGAHTTLHPHQTAADVPKMCQKLAYPTGVPGSAQIAGSACVLGPRSTFEGEQSVRPRLSVARRVFYGADRARESLTS